MEMKRTRASFKLALHHCRHHEEQMRADASAKYLLEHNSSKFWSSIKKTFNLHTTKYATCIDGVTGDPNIANLWMDHFSKLYNSVQDSSSKCRVHNRLSVLNGLSDLVNFSLNDIYAVLQNQAKR